MLAAGGGAIAAATFRHLADRQAFTCALDFSLPLVFVEWRAPRAVRVQRAASPHAAVVAPVASRPLGKACVPSASRAARVSTSSGQRALRASCWAVLPCTSLPIGP